VGAGVSLLKGHGDGTFAAPTLFPTRLIADGGLVTADFNRDGNLDLALMNRSASTGTDAASRTGTVSILSGRGDGTLVVAPFSMGGNADRSLAAADFDGDGKTDAAVVPDGLAFGVTVYRGNGDGTLQTAGLYQTAAGSLLSGDVNGDGKPDILSG